MHWQHGPTESTASDTPYLYTVTAADGVDWPGWYAEAVKIVSRRPVDWTELDLGAEDDGFFPTREAAIDWCEQFNNKMHEGDDWDGQDR